ncbi:hypothetical protein GC176_03590 [bacterium]|nr:hypothetical protein [bacterium]
MSLCWKRLPLLILLLLGSTLLPGCSDDSDGSRTASHGSEGSGAEASDPAAAGDAAASVLNSAALVEAGATTEHSAGDGSATPSAYCKNWPQPAAVFAVTGQMHGYLEPCGCSDPQYGGVSRRAALLQQLRDRGWHTIPLDLGGTLKRSRQQSQFKFQALLTALRKMKYEALAMGEEELRLGGGWLLSQHVTDPDDPGSVLSFLSANVVLFDSPDLGTPIPFKVIESGGKRIGITSVIEPALAEQIGGLADAGVTVSDPDEALARTQAALQAENVDLMVLLSHCRLETSKQLAQQHPEFQIVFSTGPVEEPYADNPTQIGKSTLIVVGHKGKNVGVAGWYPDSADNPVRFEMVRLDGERFKDPPEMLDLMRFYQDMLKDSNLAETEPALPHRSGASFVGSEKCGECHTKAFEKWKETGHAKAFESLRKGRRGIPRIYDPECLACHVTGWDPQEIFRYESGYLNEKSTPQLLGSGCENCHGPGSRHIELVEDEKLDEARKLMRTTLEQAKNSGCYKCHDLDNSPHFDFDSYWKKIAHPGLD